MHFKEDEPVFGRIESIILHSSFEPLFVLDVLETVKYNSHFHSYQVSIPCTTTFSVCHQKDFKDYHALGIYQPFNSQLFFICLKYYVLDNVDTAL